MITSIARDYIRTDKLDKYRELIYKLINETRKEQGNISYTLFSDLENEGWYILIEEWKDRESLEKHFLSEHFCTIVPMIKELHVADSIVNIYCKEY